MTITTPTALEVVTKSELVTARIESQPLHKILRGVNFLYQHHRPALVDVVLTGEPDTARDQAFEFSIRPSADSLTYRVIVGWNQEAAGNTQVIVKEFRTSTTSYHVINSHTSTAYAGGESTVSERFTIDATATRLRVEFVASAKYNPGHVLAYPEPLTTPASSSSGFRAYDDGLWGSAGAPLHTELINRCKSSAVAVLRDRKQVALSLCQEHSISPLLDGKYNTSFYSYGSISMPIAQAVCSLPGQSKTEIDLYCIGYTDSATPGTFYKVRVSQIGGGAGSSVIFQLSNAFDNLPATDAEQTQKITLYGEAPRVEVSIISGDATGTYKCVLNSLIGLWTPGD